jgi:hypothetical protein
VQKAEHSQDHWEVVIYNQSRWQQLLMPTVGGISPLRAGSGRVSRPKLHIDHILLSSKFLDLDLAQIARKSEDYS